MNTLKYERLIAKLCLNENISISNFNNITENDDIYLTFQYSTLHDQYLKTCKVLINLNTNSLKEIKEFIKEDFCPEFIRMLKKEDVSPKEFVESLYSSSDEDDDDYESESSVAAGLGFYIDDDGEWTPSDDRDDTFTSYEYPRIYEYDHEVDKNTIVIENEYDNFIVTYQVKE